MNPVRNLLRLILPIVFTFFIPLLSAQAIGYQEVSLGNTIRIGEFLFEDDYTASTADCTLKIYNPAGTLKDTGTMLEYANGWHYYDYAVGAGEALGNWPTSMACGTAGVDLVIVDKTFTVIPARTTTDGWTVTLSDFGGTTVNTAYKAKLQVLNYLTVPTDADSLPAVVITDSAGTVKVSNGEMTWVSNGTYSYSYSIVSPAVGGVWETKVSVIINGQTIKVYDYWTLSSSPADVQIIEITDKTIPTITASVRIDNKGTSDSDFYYVYCIVSSADNLCGGNDDVDSGSATAFINAGGFVNLSLTLDEVAVAGTYWFKIKARALAETNWAAATKQFTAAIGETFAEHTFNFSSGGTFTFNAIDNDHPCDFTFPADFYSESLDLQANSYSKTFFETSKPVPSGKSFLGKTYDFNLFTSSSSQVTAVSKAVTIVCRYTDADVSGLDESTIVPYRWVSSDSVWQLISGSTVDTVNNKVTFSTTLFSSFSLLAAPPPSSSSSGGGGGGGGGGPAAIAPAIPAESYNSADFNRDGKVNSIDFSILLFFWKTSPPFANPYVDINKDDKVNSVDFSILLYQWNK